MTLFFVINKRYIKPKGQERMDSPETMTRMGTQDTGRRQTKLKTEHNTEN